jgi:transposase
MGAKYKARDYEVLRRRCVELKEAKWPQKAIAEALGLTEGWVSQTLKKYREAGPAGLLARKPTGAPTKLNQQQLAQLVHELNKGAQQHGYTGAVWTRARVKAVIEKIFGVSYDPTQIGRILKKLGWSLQKPAKKARQQNAQKVQEWRENKLPELKKS